MVLPYIFFTYLRVANPKTSEISNDKVKVQIKSEKLTPFGVFFSAMEPFNILSASMIGNNS